MGETTRRRFLDHARYSLAVAPLLALDFGPAQAQPATGEPGHSMVAGGGRITAEEFGAVGDAVRDDRPAIQAAIDALEAAGGGILLLANKRYRIDGAIEVDPTRVSISGARSILDCRHAPAGSAAIVVRSKQQGAQYEQGTQFIEGIMIEGGGARTDLTGISLQTSVPNFSSRLVLRNLVIKDVAVGVDFGARTYLCQCYSLQIYSVRTGIVFTSNEDAGENISFYGCSIFNSDLALENRSGAYANFIGCSFDYCRQWFLGTGLNQFSSCWFEKHRPEGAEDYPFDLITGEIAIFGGGIQISGINFAEGNRNRYMFMIRDRLARVILNGTSAWNWRTATDELAGGAGSITVRGLGGGGNKFVPVALKDDRRHNVFGPAGEFEQSAIRLPCWIEADGATRVSAHELAWRNGSATYAKSSASIATDIVRSGKSSLRIRKGIGPGTPFSFNIASPIAPGEGFGLRLWYRLGVKPGGPFWFQIFFSQFVSTDEFGVPRIGSEQFWGEIEVQPKDANTEWRRISFNSHNIDETSDALGIAPAWATHVRLHIGMASFAGETDLWIDDIGGWRF